MTVPPDTTLSATTVLIVGGGPVGIVSAILLARFGIKSLVLEKYERRLGQPKAHALNPRSLEIFAQAGLNTKALRERGVSAQDGDAVRFAASMAGVQFGSLLYERQDDQVKELTPEPLFNLAQPKLEEFLEGEARKSDLISIWKPVEWIGCQHGDDDSIVSAVRDRTTSEIHNISSRYLLGCDGAHAKSRDNLGLSFAPLNNKPEPLHHVSVHFKADLSHMASGTLWFIMNETSPGIFICYDRTNNWVFVRNYDPSHLSPESFTAEYCRRSLDHSLGCQVDYEIIGITKWTTTPEIANAYRSKVFPQAFLVGDAAHSFPPTGGLGVNTGIADAHNLAWKISGVENGWASLSLLNSYTDERRPIAIANARQSRLNQVNIYRLMRTIASEGHNAEHAMTQPGFRAMVAESIKANAEHFNSLNLQLGYIYGREMTTNCSDYAKECVPGARLPHAWIQRAGRTISTLDLIPIQAFALLATSDFVWDEDTGFDKLPLVILRLSEDFSDADKAWTELVGIAETSSALLIRPDHHIVQNLRSMEEVRIALDQFLN